MTKRRIPAAQKHIKIHINKYHQTIIDMIREQNRCDHRWVKYGRGFRCDDCDYYTGMDKRLNQLITKLLKSNKL